MDEATTGQLSDSDMTAVKFRLGIFAEKAMTNNTHGVHLVAWKHIFLNSGHVDCVTPQIMTYPPPPNKQLNSFVAVSSVALLGEIVSVKSLVRFWITHRAVKMHR